MLIVVDTDIKSPYLWRKAEVYFISSCFFPFTAFSTKVPHWVDCVCSFRTGEFIIGRVIKAMNNSWHPECFRCDLCQEVLADIGFVKNAGR